MSGWIWVVLFFVVMAMWTYTLIDIVRRRHSMSGAKIAAWVIAIFVFPVLGSIAYFFVNGVGGGSGEGAPRDPMVGPMP